MRAVAADIHATESSDQGRRKRLHAYVSKVRQNRGEDYAMHCYKITWALMEACRDGELKALKARSTSDKERWYEKAAWQIVGVIGAVVAAAVIYLLGFK